VEQRFPGPSCPHHMAHSEDLEILRPNQTSDSQARNTVITVTRLSQELEAQVGKSKLRPPRLGMDLYRRALHAQKARYPRRHARSQQATAGDFDAPSTEFSAGSDMRAKQRRKRQTCNIEQNEKVAR
jgi:hypothetical protein